MELELILEIVAILLTVGIGYIGVKFVKVRKFLKTIIDAVEDKKITKKELLEIIEAGRDCFKGKK
jgi:hypothetical protein